MPETILYVDGFNFYYGVTDYFRPRGPGLSGLCWCDFGELATRLAGCPPGAIKYFTAPVTRDLSSPRHPGEPDRYGLWRRALDSVPGLTVIEGYYKYRPEGRMTGREREEKQTDVNIAVELVLDACAGRCRHAVLLSGDFDLIPAVVALISRVKPPVPVTVILPPSVSEQSWNTEFQATYTHRETPSTPGMPVKVLAITEELLANCLLRYSLPNRVQCPPYWRLPAAYLDKLCDPHRRPDRTAPMTRTAAERGRTGYH